LESSRALVGALADAAVALTSEKPGNIIPPIEQLTVITDALIAQEDTECGGFGGAPKFPVTPALLFLQGEGASGHEPAAGLVSRTLPTYADSDLRDAVEGGFFRYATMRDFSDPHYERMLYDNAGLLSAYARAGDLDTAAGIVQFLRTTLLVEGGFGSAQDSESIIDGRPSEGGYYLLDAKGRKALTPPAVDDKVITGWNGLALRGLADAHRAGVAGNPGELGEQVATWLLENHLRDDGSLIRLSRRGTPSSAPATLEDYGGLCVGLLELGLALGHARFVAEAFRLLESIAGREHTLGQDEVMRQKGFTPRPDIQEGAVPSGVALIAQALVLAATLRGDYGLRDRAQNILGPHVSQALMTPLGAGGVLEALATLAREEREIIVVSDQPTEMTDVVLRYRAPGTVILSVTGDQAQQLVEVGVEILRGRTEGSTPTAYVCHRGVCQLPVHTAEDLRAQLQQ
jgi:uncharacterized protein YyaL (SSP411 family)